MTIYPFNIYEKSFTPYFASLAPKHLVHRHKIQRQPSRQTAFWRDTKTKTMMRWIKSHILTKTYWYHLGIILFAIGVDVGVRKSFVSFYQIKNQKNSLAYAQEMERAYLEERKRTHPEEFEEDEEEEEEELAAVVEEEEEE